MGWTAPVGVTKLRSTTTGVEVGLSSETYSASAPAVEPPAKYHVAEVVLWHGACGPARRAVHRLGDRHATTGDRSPSRTPTSPTTAAGMGGATTPWAGTATAVCAVAPASVTAVMVGRRRARRRVGEHEEARRHAPGGRLPRAVPGGRLRVGRADQRARVRRGADRRRGPPDADGDADARDDEHHEGEHAPPALTAQVGRRHSVTVLVTSAASAAAARCGRRRAAPGAVGRRPPAPARPRRPARAGRRAGRAGTARARARPGPWPARRTAPPSRTPGCRGTALAVHGQREAARPARSRRRGCPAGTAPGGRPAVDERARAPAASPPRPPRSGTTDAVHRQAAARALRRHRHGLAVLEHLHAEHAGDDLQVVLLEEVGVRARPAAARSPTAGRCPPSTGPARRPRPRSARRRAPAAGPGARCRRTWPAGRPWPPGRPGPARRA